MKRIKQILSFENLEDSYPLDKEILSLHNEILSYIQNDKYYGTCSEIHDRLYRMRDLLSKTKTYVLTSHQIVVYKGCREDSISKS